MSLLFTAVLSILVIAATAAVNIKIKSAADAATATREVVALGLRIG